MDLQLKGKTAVVTGGAQGIGAGISRVLAGEGVNVVINDFCEDAIAQEACDQLEKDYHVQTLFIKGDVSDPENAERVLEACREKFGGVDILVNNAGIGGRRCSFEELTYADWKKVQDIDLNGPFLLSSCFIRYWKKNHKSGHIVNTISKAAFLSAKTGNEAYVSAKLGLFGLTRAMAKDCAPDGIWVNGIIPGYVFNSRLKNRKEGLATGNQRYETMMESGRLPLGEFATPEEIGSIVAFLCSPVSKQVCGTAIDCSGGTLM